MLMFPLMVLVSFPQTKVTVVSVADAILQLSPSLPFSPGIILLMITESLPQINATAVSPTALAEQPAPLTSSPFFPSLPFFPLKITPTKVSAQ